LLSSVLQNNKKIYLTYNNFRKHIFSSISPKESPVILHMLPWLLSVNRVAIPGYIKDLKEPFRIFNIENERDIFKQESTYKKAFDIKDDKSLMRPISRNPIIQGIYTIGSIGTISQTSRSDCDIWICIDNNDFDDKAKKHLHEKINLIKDWLDSKIKIPVYFFLTDIEDIRKCNFGNMDYQSCGSAQKNVLKEEFYRTSILICGKIPFWWVCYNGEEKVDYDQAFANNKKIDFGEPDFIDMGNLEEVRLDEYFGAALWQFNKSLTHPLKSIIKMLQLKMFLESPKEELLCHKFRKIVLDKNPKENFTDPSIFAMNAVLEYYSKNVSDEYLEFIKKCFYLRFDMKMMSKKQTLKEEMAAGIFKKYRIERKEIYNLNEFESWTLQEQIYFGELMFEFLKDIYMDIVRIQEGKSGEIAPQDMTIIGRKLSSSLEIKEHKVPLRHIPSETIKLPVLTFATDGRTWRVSSSDDQKLPLITNEDIIFCLAFITWNGIYDPAQIRMQPNQTSVTIQEIINLGRKINDVFGSYDIASVNFSNFLQTEKISKMLIVVNFDNESSGMDIRDFCVIYKNNWEEFFVKRFSSAEIMKAFFTKAGKVSRYLEPHYYIQRNTRYYEKIIERTKNMIAQMLASD
jgi:adenylate cyclase, class 1